MQKKKFLYVIPKKVVGGAETIHAKFAECETKTSLIIKMDLDFQEVKPFYIYRSFKRLKAYIEQQKVDVVISSLWRSHFICLIVSKFVNIEIIPFFHSSSFRSIIDRYFTKKILNQSIYFIADSLETKKFINCINPEKKGFTVSLFLSQTTYYKKKFPEKLQKFIFVGRKHKVKNIPESIELIKKYSTDNPELLVIFDLYGPQEKNFKLKICNPPSNLKINLKGAIEPHLVMPTILKYDCFIQTSKSEGFSLIAKDALRAGQLCILTAVGDLKHWLSHDNCIIHNSIGLTVQQMNKLTREEYSKKSEKAIESFKKIEVFQKSFVKIIDLNCGKTQYI
jgi:glycosyltransferase involved in cell wall biosynthesis